MSREAAPSAGAGKTEETRKLGRWLTLLIIILLAGLAGVVAAILPSRRAAKLNVLRAIVTE